MGLAEKLAGLRWRSHHHRPLPDAFTAPLHGALALEIGGPSAVFRRDGLAPAYPLCAGIDGVQWAQLTVWHGEQSGAYAPDGEVTGRLHLTEGGTLEGVPDGAYDAVLSSHVIEHFANPLRALAAWRRVATPHAALLLVAPHKAGTFDHKRPVTPLAHMISDYERGVGEDDLTHLEETLALHDPARDVPREPDWERDRRENVRYRVIHHHVFDTRSLVDLLVHAGIDVTAVEVRHPHDIYVAGRFGSGTVDPELLAGALRRSPFKADAGAAAATGAA
jgi:SAM-dependent methyltransferase